MKLKTNTRYKNMAQALDGLRWFLPNKDFKVDLVDGIREGKDLNEVLDYLSDHIWKEMNKPKNLTLIKEKGIYGKKQYYPEGNWTDDPKKPGCGYLKLDLKGQDQFLKYQIRNRIKQYCEMIHEYDLLSSLINIGCFKSVRMATLQEDTRLKADVVITDGHDDEWYISVYKSSDKKALSKLANSDNADVNRLSYNVCKYGKANLQNTKKWVNDVMEKQKNIIYVDESNQLKIS